MATTENIVSAPTGKDNIPVNKNCSDCGALTWREELGASDRFWHDGFVCYEHMQKRIIESKKAADAFQEIAGLPRIYQKDLGR